MRASSLLVASGLVASGLIASHVEAAFIPNALTGVTAYGFQQGDGATSADPGNVIRVVNGAGLSVNGVNETDWVHNNAWQDGWQGNAPTANPIEGSLILELGPSARSDLSKMYVWNVAEGGATIRGTANADIWYATNPSPAPTANTLYTFSVGNGWTLLQAGKTFTQAAGNNADLNNGSVSLTGISARYIGIDMNAPFGQTGGTNPPNRIGFAEIQVTTVVPEPAGLSLAALVMTGLLRRRRRQC